MGQADQNANRRREWARIAHDALHELDRLLDLDPACGSSEPAMEARQRVHDALHKAVGHEAPPAETAASDLRPFDRAFSRIAREHGVAAVWIAALDGKLHGGGHVELNETIQGAIAAGLEHLGQCVTGPKPGGDGLWTPNGTNTGIIVPGQGG